MGYGGGGIRETGDESQGRGPGQRKCYQGVRFLQGFLLSREVALRRSEPVPRLWSSESAEGDGWEPVGDPPSHAPPPP